MKGKFSDRVTPLMTSAIKIACSSLSITQGPAIRNSPPAPILTLSIWKDALMGLTTEGTGNTEGTATGKAVLSSSRLLRPVEHFHFRRRFVSAPFQSVFIRCAHESLK